MFTQSHFVEQLATHKACRPRPDQAEKTNEQTLFILNFIKNFDDFLFKELPSAT